MALRDVARAQARARRCARPTCKGQDAAAWLLRAHARLIDRTLQDLWRAHAPVPRPWRWWRPAATAAASCFPYSDIDVLVLLGAEPRRDERGRVEQLIGMFWDIGLEIGHSVRTVEACVESAQRTSPSRPRCSRRACSPAARRCSGGCRRAIGERSRPGGFLQGEEARAGAAPRQAPGHALRARAEPEGGARRAARPAGHPLDRAAPAASAGTGATSPAAACCSGAKRCSLARHETAAAGPARPPALPRRPARGPPRCSTSRTRWRPSAATPASADAARQRAADAALLPRRQGDHAAEHDPAAEPAGALRPGAGRRAARAQRALPGARRAARGAARGPVRARAARDPRELPADAAARRAARHDRRDPARAVARARQAGREASGAIRSRSCCSCRSCSSRAASCTSSGA